MTNKAEIYRALDQNGFFSVASLQRDFGLSYSEAREFTRALENQKKASLTEDGITYKYQTPLKTVKEQKASAFDRWFKKRKLSPEELQTQEVQILQTIAKAFGGELDSNGELAYTLDLSLPGHLVPKVYIDVFDGNFRVHDNHYINKTYKEDYELDTKKGALVMNRILRRKNYVMSLDDGTIGYGNVTPSNVEVAIRELVEVLEYLNENDTLGLAICDSVEQVFITVNHALGMIFSENSELGRDELIAHVEKLLKNSDYLSDEEDAGYEIIRDYLEKLIDPGFTHAKGIVVNERSPKYVYKEIK